MPYFQLFPGETACKKNVRFIGSPLLYLLLFAAQVLFFSLCICCYCAVPEM